MFCDVGLTNVSVPKQNEAWQSFSFTFIEKLRLWWHDNFQLLPFAVVETDSIGNCVQSVSLIFACTECLREYFCAFHWTRLYWIAAWYWSLEAAGCSWFVRDKFELTLVRHIFDNIHFQWEVLFRTELWDRIQISLNICGPRVTIMFQWQNLAGHPFGDWKAISFRYAWRVNFIVHNASDGIFETMKQERHLAHRCRQNM